MLLLQGKLTYRNLNTTYTHLDQFIVGLEKERFTGYCTLSFWEYDAVFFLMAGKIVNGREEIGVRAATVRTGEAAVANILAKGREKDGEINAYSLPTEHAAMLITSVDGTPKYENLSTDLTGLDRLMAMCKKESLSGYIEIVFENGAGTANLFFVGGRLAETIFAPLDNRMLGDAIGLDDIISLCREHGAVFTVYQANPTSASHEPDIIQGEVPEEALHLFEALFVNLETIVDDVLKPGEFQTIFKKTLTQLDNTYDFLDPFLGDFRYAHKTLSYSGVADYQVFVEGMCDLVNTMLAAVFEQTSQAALLPRLSTAFEQVTTEYFDVIEQLHLESRLPELFQDYAFIYESKEQQSNHDTARAVINLQGGGVPDIGSESILREFYRVLSLISQKYIVADRMTFQYARFKKSSEYQQYQTATALLQNFDITLIRRPEASLTFWLNLYNFLVIDGILKHDITTSVQDCNGFFSKTSYRLGGYAFSLDEIEHGILRNNQRRPYTLFRPFGGSDPRRTLRINPLEPAIHCCLISGAVSSPGLRLYTPRQFSAQMSQAVNQFLKSEHGMRVDVEKKEIWLNRAFYWYRRDFEQPGSGIIDFIIHYLTAADVKRFLAKNRSQLTLRFMDYNWNLNAS